MGNVPLDEDTRRFLDELRAAPAMDLLGIPPEQARLVARAGIFAPDPAKPMDIRDECAQMPGECDVPVRIYRPGNADESASALLYLHGGGWLVGDLDTVDHVCRAIAHDAGCVVISAQYRLAPENPFPAGLQDASTVLRWIAGQSTRLRFNPSKIAVGGDSAGANLAIALCLHTRDVGGPHIGLQLLAYPITDYRFDTASYRENAEGYLLTKQTMIGYWERYLARPGDGDSPYASVVRANVSGLPPALVLTASFDPLRDEGEALARRFAESGVPVRCIRFNGTIHGFLVRFPIIAAGRVALTTMTDAMRAFSDGEPLARPTSLTIEHFGPLVYSVDPPGQ